MPAFRPVRRLVEAAVTAGAVIAFAAILATVAITLADIVLRAIGRLALPFTGTRLTWAVPGLVDLSQLMVIVAASLSIPFAFLNDGHVAIDLLDRVLPRGLRRLAALLAAALALGLVGGCLWHGWAEMRMQQQMHTSSATLGIPQLYYYAPLLAGLGLSLLAIIGRLLPGGGPARDEARDA